MSKLLPSVGDILSNGATVLKSKNWSHYPSDWYLGVVLCIFDNQFVTWVYNTECQGTYEGHYFQNLEEALFDYEKRGE